MDQKPPYEKNKESFKSGMLPTQKSKVCSPVTESDKKRKLKDLQVNT